MTIKITHLRPVFRDKKKADDAPEPLHNEFLANIPVNDETEELRDYRQSKLKELRAEWGHNFEDLDLTYIEQ